MHALNGEWQDLDVSSNLNDDVLNNGEGIVTEESSSTSAETTEHSSRFYGRGCYDALDGICSSTPSLDPCKNAVRPSHSPIKFFFSTYTFVTVASFSLYRLHLIRSCTEVLICFLFLPTFPPFYFVQFLQC